MQPARPTRDGDTSAATSASDDAPSAEAILARGRAVAAEAGLPFAGEIGVEDAFALLAAGAARLVDVRSPEEWKFVGRIPNAVHVAWATGTSLAKNARFVPELEEKVGKDEVLLMLCRSGKRSGLAAAAATTAGFRHAYNVRDGFEGDLDARGQRGHLGGWRHRGLPWVQD